ncbi:MAG TPA: hypothetical protein PLB91_08210 [Spirochaetales bacterium]|nr:hypothetical protein [Spirochaetales bacterium]HRY53558.1 hypothetical protein [Spirochaetia bacterium]HRZ63378.1 hypothetical protein [Spirochaetia bacterium]
MLMPFLRRLGRALGASALILGLSAALVWPLWALATKARTLYNAAILLALLALGGAAAWRRIRRRRSEPSSR